MTPQEAEEYVNAQLMVKALQNRPVGLFLRVPRDVYTAITEFGGIRAEDRFLLHPVVCDVILMPEEAEHDPT